MDVEETIKFMLIAYPDLFPTRGAALHHLFVVNGCGYDWEDGALVGARRQDEADLSFWRRIARIWADRYLQQTWEERNWSDKVRRIFDADPEWRAMHEYDYEAPPDLPRRLADLSYAGKVYPICMYANVARIPDDVRPEWLAAAREALAVVKFRGGESYDDEGTRNNIKWIARLERRLAKRFGAVAR